MSTARSVDPDHDSTAAGTDQFLPEEAPEPVCCGLCLYPSDIGLSGHDNTGPAYINPMCPDHAESPDDPYEEVRVHELHEGSMGVC
ncbi:hypothetical protein [Streptomyces sp. Wh19]|uniref:hypothetical protein n=1 Tax=Streptomyces sp. Wh19 TaxID=3076629 RepID=UPI0029585C98|nr:hypothetical protein [Streptomyces sp. Wh19]MDV9194470.1 hypothetical protein [Streptomyces sp. Wh19]